MMDPIGQIVIKNEEIQLSVFERTKKFILERVNIVRANIIKYFGNSTFLDIALSRKTEAKFISMFDIKAFDEYVVSKNFDYLSEILRNYNENTDGDYDLNFLLSSPIIFREALYHKDMELILKLNLEVTEENILLLDKFVADNLEFVKNYFEVNYDGLLNFFEYSRVLLEEYIKQGNFKMIDKFNESFFTEEFISDNLELIMSNMKDKLPCNFGSSQILFNEYYKQKNFDLLVQFYNSFFTEEFISDNLEWIMSNIKDELPYKFRKSQILFNECVRQKRFDLLIQFNESFFTEEFISDNLEWIISNIKDEIPENFKSSQVLFDECVRQKNFDLLIQFYVYFFTDDFVFENSEWIMSNIKKKLPYALTISQAFLNECVKQKRFDFIIQFDKSLITEEFISNNLEWIMSNIKDELPDVFFSSKILFSEYAKQKKLDLLFRFDERLLTEEFIQNNLEWIINNITDEIPGSLKKSKVLFDEFYKQKRFDLLIQFYGYLFTPDFISENLECIMSNIRDELPFAFKNSQVLFDECAKQKKFDLLIQFYGYLFTPDFIFKNLEWIMSNIKDELPLELICSQALFDAYVEKGDFDFLMKFNESLFTEEFISNNLEWIISNIKDELPRHFRHSLALFNECLNKKNDNILVQMDSSFFTYDVLKDNYSYFVSLIKNNGIFHNIIMTNRDFKRLVLDHKDYDVLIMLLFDADLLIVGQDGKIGFNQTKLQFYSDIIGISEEELANKIRDLLKINDEILNTICPFMLSKKMNCLSFKNLEKISVYPDIQFQINKLSQKEIMILNRILNYLDNDLDSSFDISTIVYYIITNWDLNTELIATINSNELTNEQVANLIFVLQRKNDFYNIKTMDDLKPTNFDKLTSEIFQGIEDRVLSGNISIEELRRAIMEKKYGLDLESAEFINTRYCQDIDIVNESNGLSKSSQIILQGINYILTIENKEELSFLYLTATRMKDNYYAFVDLEARIRQDYAKKYSESLYKIKDEHLMKREDFETPGLYEIVSNITYNGKKPQFYVLDGDFNLQIHVLGAYRDWKRPANFKEDWERPKIAYHGICTSYIGNNQIANARQYHPAYGFDSYEAESLMTIQNSDINSNKLNVKFAISRIKPCAFYPPKEMIDKTRHSHNEFVLERRNSKNGNSFKRLPNYVVYIVDDINNEDNYDMANNDLFNESVQAAVDNGIPIVIVDHLKYAKSEKQKYEALLERFEKQPNPIDLKDILLIVCDNMIGCQKFGTQQDMAYHKYFNQNVLTDVLDKMIETIQKQPEKVREMLIIELYKYSLKEPLIKDTNKTKIEQLYNGLNLTNNNVIDERKGMLRKILDYYKMASENIREAIALDLNSGLSYGEIYAKILNTEYHDSKKLS